MIEMPLIHADGCTTNLSVIGATCNCGVEAQQKEDLKWFVESIEKSQEKAFAPGFRLVRIERFIQELKDKLAELED